MIRFALSFVVVVSFFTVAARADDHPQFTVVSEATRSGNVISVSLKIVENKTEEVPGVGKTTVTTTKFSPRVMLFDGRQAQIVSGSGPVKSGSQPTTDPADIGSGVKFDVISIKGQDRVLVITTVVEDGLTVWADAATVKVQPKPPGDKK